VGRFPLHIRGAAAPYSVRDWQASGLLKPSVIKTVLTTLDQRLVRKTLGRLSETDRSAPNAALQLVLG
jgi:mRNA interferase MazF